MHELVFLPFLGALADLVAVDGVLVGARDSVVGGDEGVLHQFDQHLADVIIAVTVIHVNLHLNAFALETDIPVKTSLEFHLSLLHAPTHDRVGARLAVIGDDVLPKRLPDDQRNGVGLREFGSLVVYEVGDEAVLYLGVVLGRFKASRNIIGKFYRKGIDVFASGEMGVLELVEQVLHVVEVLAACVLDPVL